MTKRAIARRDLLSLLGAGMGLAWAGSALPALAATPSVVLDEERRAALAALPVLRDEGSSVGSLLERLEGRSVVLTFFASWCPPCHVEFDELNQLRATRDRDDVEIVAVNIFEDFFPGTERLVNFLAGKAPAFTILGGGEAVAGLFGEVTRIPTLFVFGPDGASRLHFIHVKDARKMHAGLEEIEAALDR